jgi:hypothetical protein
VKPILSHIYFIYAESKKVKINKSKAKKLKIKVSIVFGVKIFFILFLSTQPKELS